MTILPLANTIPTIPPTSPTAYKKTKKKRTVHTKCLLIKLGSVAEPVIFFGRSRLEETGFGTRLRSSL